MPDGQRRRRHSANAARRKWYAAFRAQRFARRFGWLNTASIQSGAAECRVK